ncbi:MAG TPA: SCO family protein [Gemmataceae bacterium]|nr:SCO family protein [Gemmataceae bacterium]
MCSRVKKGLTSIALLAITLTVATSILQPSKVAVAQEIPDPNLIFKPPDESRLLGRKVPDIGLRYADGSSGRLSDLWAERPVFVTLVFSRCVGICSPYLGLLKKTVEQVGSSGDRYQMVVISFDLRDHPEDLKDLAKHHGLEADRGWTFAAPASQQDLTALCQALDFDFRWDEARQQYNHPAITVALRSGTFVRISVGEEISPRQFAEMLADARGEFVPFAPIPGRRGALFRCFDYDPQRGFTPNWGMLILVFPAAAALTLAAGIFMAARFGRSSGRNSQDALSLERSARKCNE